MPPALSPEVQALEGEAVRIRRDLHQHPELGFAETRTAGLVADHLRASGIELRTGVARTGVIGLIRGARPGKTLMLRADMDALPLPEEKASTYQSRTPNVMHACGHDGHVAMALVAARVLAGMRERLHGNVKLCFQPAEEGPGGAEPMIRDGVLEGPRVDAAIGIHIWNDMDAGTLGVGTGPMLAATDTFEVLVEGKGGHGAYPHAAIDPVVVAAHIVTALQTIVSRSVGPLQSAVVSVGKIQAGYAANIIPRTATLTGTLRSYEEPVRELLARRVQEIATGIAEAFGARAAFLYHQGYPPTVNDAAMSRFVAAVAEPVFGSANVLTEPERSMGGEDMSYYLREVPGTFLFLGSRNRARGLDAPHHSPFFDFDEGVLTSGAETLVRSALAYLADEA